MSVLSAQSILARGLINPCLPRTTYYHSDPTIGTLTYGLGPAGYDLTLDWGADGAWSDTQWILEPGEFRLAAASEHFSLPSDVTAMIYDKSTWARRGLSLFNTVAEPGWFGYLTLELKNMGSERLFLPQGVPIAQVVFTQLDKPTEYPYSGKYQNQQAGPQSAL